jgi:integrase
VGKGDKARVGYLPAKAVRHLRSYISEFHGPTPDPGAYLFWSRNHPAGTHQLSQDAVTRMLQKHAARANAECPDVPVGLTAHRFRHFVAGSHMLRASANPQVTASDAAMPAT